MKTKPERVFSGIWALTWRSTVFLPVGLAVFVLLVALLAALVVPPVYAAVYLYYGLWWQGISTLVVWALVIWAWRHFRLSRFFESPPSLL